MIKAFLKSLFNLAFGHLATTFNIPMTTISDLLFPLYLFYVKLVIFPQRKIVFPLN